MILSSVSVEFKFIVMKTLLLGCLILLTIEISAQGVQGTYEVVDVELIEFKRGNDSVVDMEGVAVHSMARKEFLGIVMVLDSVAMTLNWPDRQIDTFKVQTIDGTIVNLISDKGKHSLMKVFQQDDRFILEVDNKMRYTCVKK